MKRRLVFTRGMTARPASRCRCSAIDQKPTVSLPPGTSRIQVQRQMYRSQTSEHSATIPSHRQTPDIRRSIPYKAPDSGYFTAFRFMREYPPFDFIPNPMCENHNTESLNTGFHDRASARRATAENGKSLLCLHATTWRGHACPVLHQIQELHIRLHHGRIPLMSRNGHSLHGVVRRGLPSASGFYPFNKSRTSRWGEVNKKKAGPKVGFILCWVNQSA